MYRRKIDTGGKLKCESQLEPRVTPSFMHTSPKRHVGAVAYCFRQVWPRLTRTAIKRCFASRPEKTAKINIFVGESRTSRIGAVRW